MIDEERLEEEIRQVAYEIYVKSGCIPGRDLDNWLEAKRIVLEKYGLIQSETSEEKQEKKKSKRVCKRSSSPKKGKGRGKKS